MLKMWENVMKDKRTKRHQHGWYLENEKNENNLICIGAMHIQINGTERNN